MKTKTKKDFFILWPLFSLWSMAFFVGFINASLAQDVHNNEVVYRVQDAKNVNVIHGENIADLESTVQLLESDDKIEIAEPNYLRYIQAQPNDYYYSYQWHLYQSNDKDIDANQAWKLETGTKKSVIAVLDTGVDTDHPDLAANIWENSDEIAGNGIDDDNNGYIDDVNGWDFVSNDNDPNPDPDGKGSDYGVTHGSHVAGIIAGRGNNDIGISGVCWKCRIMPIQVMDDEGIGTISAIYNGIYYAIDNGADVLNLSFGSYDFSATEKAAIDAALDAGIIVVAAAGNDNYNLNQDPIYPACHSGVIAVAATNESDKKSAFSNYGADCVDVSAPGSYILSTLYTNDYAHGFSSDYGYMSGTSMATPVVAGVAGLLEAYQPKISKTKVINYIINKADDKNLGAKMGSGRVNAYRTLKAAQPNLSPNAPKTIKAYTGKKKKKRIKAGTISRDRTPYFVWTAAKTNRGKITGYYVYWGRKKNANPTIKGKFQKKRKYSVAGKKKINRQKKTTFYLKIKSKNSLGKKSKKAKTFKYVYKPKK